MVPFELLDALDGQDRRASAQCDDDGVKHGPGEEAEEVPPLDCRFIGLLLDVRIGVQGDAACRCFAGRASHHPFCALRNIALRVE